MICNQCSKIKTETIKWSGHICRTCYKKNWRHKTNKTNTNWKILPIETVSLRGIQNESIKTQEQQLRTLILQKKNFKEIQNTLNIPRTTLKRRIKNIGLEIYKEPAVLSKNLTIEDKLGHGGFYIVKCKSCGHESNKTKYDLRYGCGKCFESGQSAGEKDLKTLLNIDFRKIKLLDKFGRKKEIDMYSHVHKVGIEYCGLYWHNENSPTPRNHRYHADKAALAEANGIRLITIFEDEWMHRRSQMLNYLKSVFNLNTVKLYARNCWFKTINKQEADLFLESNHIQGKAQTTSHRFGLFHGQELVAVMTFGKHPRKNNEKTISLNRLAFKDDVTVHGGASKLFKNSLPYLSSYDTIVSWSDNRWSQGKVYGAIGFTLEHTLGPDYSYVKGRRRYSKQLLRKTATERTTGKTEKELRNEQGYSKIWDCGKKRWIFKIKN